MIPLDECAAKISAKSLDDVRSGLGLFKKVGGILMCTARAGSQEDSHAFVQPLASPIDSAAFEKLRIDSKRDFAEKHF